MPNSFFNFALPTFLLLCRIKSAQPSTRDSHSTFGAGAFISVAIVFTFGWKSRPNERIVEISMPRGDYRTRLWEHFEGDQLVKLTVIEERREPGREPERWFKGPPPA